MAITLQNYLVTLELLQPMLGTAPLNAKVFKEHVVHPDVPAEVVEEELETLEEVSSPNWTGFHKDDKGKPFIYNYMIKGFLKGACSALRRSPETESKKLHAFRKVIDQHVFVVPRRIMLRLPKGQDIFRAKSDMTKEEEEALPVPERRPLRGMTPKGERIAIAYSETAPVGTELVFSLSIIDGSAITEKMLHEWFSYGLLMGLGQWRSGGWGTFGHEIDFVNETGR
jgi:hypothetical protein